MPSRYCRSKNHLIDWSLGIGITLLVILALFNHLFPVAGA
jgi:hypothetical protein